MKKIMSVLLALVMALLLFTAMGVVTLAKARSMTRRRRAFRLTTADANGKKAARFKETLTEDEVYDLYQGNFNDDNTGWHNSEGKYEPDWSNCTYYIHDTSKLLTTGDDLVIGGYWCTAASSDLPMNALPIDFDIDLNGEKEISGVKIEATGNFGYVKAYEVYTFDGENWTLEKSGTGGQKLITASFGSNIATSKVRIRVTDTTRRTNGSASRFAADMPAYFGVSRLAVLKGASIETVAWETEPAVTEFYSSAGDRPQALRETFLTEKYSIRAACGQPETTARRVLTQSPAQTAHILPLIWARNMNFPRSAYTAVSECGDSAWRRGPLCFGTTEPNGRLR